MNEETHKPNKLFLPLAYRWFDLIAAGRKTREYRRFTEAWRKRLNRLQRGDLVVFRRGYTRKTITRKIEGIRVISGWSLPEDEYHFFGCPNEDKFFEIQFSKE